MSVVMNKVRWAWLLMLLLPVLSLAQASDPAGRVVISLGTVSAVAADGTSRRLRSRDSIYAGETINTGAAGRVQIRFTDSGLISLRKDTELKLEGYQYQNVAATDQVALRLERGSFRTVTGRIGQTNRNAYRVATPVAVIGVRGTDWEALQEPNSGPLLLGVNDGGIAATAQGGAGQTAVIGEGAEYDYAQVNPDGSIQLLVEVPQALAAAAEAEAPVEAEEEGSEGTEGSESADAATEGEGDGEEVAVDEGAAPPPPPEGGADSGSTDAAAPAADVLDVQVSVNPNEGGSGEPATEEPFETIPRVFSEEEQVDLVEGGQFALVSGIRPFADVDGPAPTLVAGGIVAPSLLEDDSTPSFNFAVTPGGLTVTSDRATLLELSGARYLRGRAITNRQDNVGGITGLTFGRFAADALDPLALFPDLDDSNNVIDLTSPVVFATFDRANVANLTGRLIYTPSSSTNIVVSTGSVSSVLGEILMDVNLGDGTIERGALDIGFGATADAFVFSADFTGTLNDGAFTGAISSIVLTDSAADQNFAATGSISGAMVGSTAVPSMVVSFDYFDLAGRNQFARGAVLFDGEVVPPPPTLNVSDQELTLLADGFFAFLSPVDAVEGGVAAGRAIDPSVLGGSTLFALNAVGPLTDFEATNVDHPDFLLLPPDAIVRQIDAPTGFFLDDFEEGLAFASLTWGEWLGSPSVPVQLLDASNGDVLLLATYPLLWQTFTPAQIADLSGFTAARSIGGVNYFGASNGDLNFVPGSNVVAEFYVDFASGAISNGRLFVATEFNPDPQNPVLLGFNIDFTGQISAPDGNLFAVITPGAGTYRASQRVDPSDMELQLAFLGDSAVGGGFTLSYKIANSSAQAIPEFVDGMLIGDFLQTFVTPTEAATLDRIGFVLFDPRDGNSNLILPSLAPVLAPGLLGGRASAVAANGGFFLAGDENGIDTELALRFLADEQLFRQASAIASDVNTNASNTAAPFQVGWGIWNFDPVNSQAATLTDESGVTVAINSDVLFASVTPTIANLTGSARFSGTTADGSMVLLAQSGPQGTPLTPYTVGQMGVDVDFNSGLLNGSFSVQRTLDPQDGLWSADFNGRLLRNVAELTLTRVDFQSVDFVVPGDLANSGMVGVVTGLNGESFFSAFQLVDTVGNILNGFSTIGRQ